MHPLARNLSISYDRFSWHLFLFFLNICGNVYSHKGQICIARQIVCQPWLNLPGPPFMSSCFSQQSSCHLYNLHRLEKYRRHAQQVPPQQLVCISVVINCESCLLGSSCCRVFKWAFSAKKMVRAVGHFVLKSVGAKFLTVSLSGHIHIFLYCYTNTRKQINSKSKTVSA